jgi:Tfp pilus assembly protein PilF/ribonuclease BN (tRNA processing enzyme)
LFRSARRSHVRLGRRATEECPEHQEALAYAREHDLKWAQALLEASLLERLGRSEDTLSMLRMAMRDMPATERGLLWQLEACALVRQNRFDEAIQACNRALADSNYDTPSHARITMATAYLEKGEYDLAQRELSKAMDDPNLESPGAALSNLGTVHHRKGEYEDAVRMYHRALEDPNYLTHGVTWNNLGIVYEVNGEYEEAAKAYQKALDDPDYDTPAKAWYNLGDLFVKTGEHELAIEALRKSLEDPELRGDAAASLSLSLAYYRVGHTEKASETLRQVLARGDVEPAIAHRAQLLDFLIRARVKENALSAEDQTKLQTTLKAGESSETEHRIIAKIDSAEHTAYEEYLLRGSSGRNNCLSVLRGWSSALTLLQGSKGLWPGGGYFVKWQDKGIVIDPGLDFLRNFHDAGYHGREIDVVLVSHNHSDHNSDLKSIDDLRYELYKRTQTREKGKVGRYVLVWDEDTMAALKFSVEAPAHQHHPIVFDIGRCEPCHEIKELRELPFSVEYFAVRHARDVPEAVGFKIHLIDEGKRSFTIGYTGDTEFFDQLPSRLAKCNLLMAHIRQPAVEELRDRKKTKKDHLGYRGLIRLIKECKPDHILVDEFWAGLSDLRIDLVKGIRERTGNKHILPAGIGLHVTLPEVEIECTECRSKVPFDDVRVSPPADRFGDLAYLCPRCMLG